MAPDNLLKTPKYLLALDAARALTVLTYIRTDEPAAVPAAYDDIMAWRVFATTDHDDLFPPVLPGDLPTKNESEEVRQAKVAKLNARKYRQLLYKATPEAVVDFLMNHDPKDEQAMGVVQGPLLPHRPHRRAQGRGSRHSRPCGPSDSRGALRALSGVLRVSGQGVPG